MTPPLITSYIKHHPPFLPSPDPPLRTPQWPGGRPPLPLITPPLTPPPLPPPSLSPLFSLEQLVGAVAGRLGQPPEEVAPRVRTVLISLVQV